jgi:membrane protein
MTDNADDSSHGLKDRASRAVRTLRQRNRTADHLIRTWQHYSRVQGNVLAGAVTYFGFLSFFPILALAFAAVGYITVVFPDARHNLTEALQQVFPGIVSNRPAPGKISLDQIANAKAATGLIGLAVLLYTGLGWLSGLRQALQTMFDVPTEKERGMVLGKVVDLVVLVIIGIVMIVSVAISGLVKGLASDILDAVGLGSGLGSETLLWVVAVVLGVCASSVLFFAMFKLLPNPDLPLGALWRGALLAAVGFELLKEIVVNVLGGVGGTPFAPLALAVTLVIWINYFSRLVLLGAAWAWTADESQVWSPLYAEAGADEERAIPAGDSAAVREPVATGALLGTAARDSRGRRNTNLMSLFSGAALGAGAASVWWATRVRSRPRNNPR